MKRIVKCMVCLLAICGILSLGELLQDKHQLRTGLIRLHVVGATNTPADQANKYQVRDVVLETLESILKDVQDQKQAAAAVEENLEQIRMAAETRLCALGAQDTAVSVSLCKESFDRRDYETFSLPAGVYDSLRVRVGSAEGKNWWCVIFPTLCLGSFRDTAVSAGFSEDLTDTLAGENEVRFFLLDCIGWTENFLFGQ